MQLWQGIHRRNQPPTKKVEEYKKKVVVCRMTLKSNHIWKEKSGHQLVRNNVKISENKTRE